MVEEQGGWKHLQKFYSDFRPFLDSNIQWAQYSIYLKVLFSIETSFIFFYF